MTRLTEPNTSSTYSAQAKIPTEWARSLTHIGADLGLTKQQLFKEAIALLLRYHGHQAPEPTLPRTAETEVGQ